MIEKSLFAVCCLLLALEWTSLASAILAHISGMLDLHFSSWLLM